MEKFYTSKYDRPFKEIFLKEKNKRNKLINKNSGEEAKLEKDAKETLFEESEIASDRKVVFKEDIEKLPSKVDIKQRNSDFKRMEKLKVYLDNKCDNLKNLDIKYFYSIDRIICKK